MSCWRQTPQALYVHRSSHKEITMLDYLLNTAQVFEREHGIAPDVIYINPLHYEQLTRRSPELFVPGSKLRLGLRLVIMPANMLAHPRAALLADRQARPAGGHVTERAGNAVAGWREDRIDGVRQESGTRDGSQSPGRPAGLAGRPEGVTIHMRHVVAHR
jgi:hypothetical protein